MAVHLTIAKKGLLLICIPLVFQLGFLPLAFWMRIQNAEAQRWTAHSSHVLVEANGILVALLEGQGGLRGLALDLGPEFTDQNFKQFEELPELLEQLPKIVSDNPKQQALAESVADKGMKFFVWIEQTRQAFRTPGNGQGVERIRSGAGKKLIDAVRADLQDFLKEEERLASERDREVDALGRQTIGLFIAGGVLSTLASVIVLWIFQRDFSRRFATLGENARRFANGEALASPLAGGDEIGELDRTFHTMSQKLLLSQMKLREQLQIVQTILASMSEGVAVVNARGEFILFNPAAEKIVGLGMADLPHDQWSKHYGVFCADGVTLFPPAESPLIRGLSGESVDGVEQVIRNVHNPQGIRLSVSARPLRDSHGEIFGSMSVFRDITLSRQVEERIRLLNEELEERVRERTSALAEANRDLREKNEENETFVYSVSHDLRSPLVNLQGFSRELTTTCGDLRELLGAPEIPDAVRAKGMALIDRDMLESISFITNGVRRLSTIIDSLLRLSRAGRVEYSLQEVPVREVVDRIVKSLHSTAHEKKATFEVGNLPDVWGDAAALERAFGNVIANALNYLDPARPGVIEISGAVEGNMVTYQVKDNGLGLDAAYLPKVFQAFQRFHPQSGPGEGMGLAIVQRVVSRHRGKIWMESTPGRGSTVFLSLPRRNVSGLD